MDNVIMICILLFLLFDILYGAKLVDVNDKFFDLKNSQAMRGFWCIVVVLVHVPAAYHNRIQDMISSFGYIGVTFFFLTSAFGLTLSQLKKPGNIKAFWRKRLPKLLIVTWMISIVYALVRAVVYKSDIKILSLFSISGWVRWLIACYFAFWLSCVLLKKGNAWKIATCLLIIAGSLVIYYLKHTGVITTTTWETECYGFVWGVVLALVRDSFLKFFSDNWYFKTGAFMVISAILGVLYLKFKTIPFGGDYLLKILLGLAITVFILSSNTRVSLGNKVNMFLGEISFELYLCHGKVYHLMNDICQWKYSSVFIICSLLVSVLVAYIIHLIANIIVKTVKRIPILNV